WAPLLYDYLTHPTASFQNRWFSNWMINSSLFQYRGTLEYIGLGYLFLAIKRGWLARFLLILLGGLILWNVIGILGMILGFPLLHSRMNVFFDVAVMFGLALGIIHLAEVAKLHLQTPPRWLIGGVSMLFLLFLGHNMIIRMNTEEYKLSYNSVPPIEIYDQELISYARGKVFFTNLQTINAHIPLYLFVGTNAHYTHPAAEFEARVAFVEAISKSDNPDFIAWMLTYNKWDKVDGVLWGDKSILFGLDNFPNWNSHRPQKVTFEQSQFTGTYFQQSQSGRWQKIVAPPKDLKASFSAKEKELVAEFAKQ
ncbi:MAG TPA: hypothetical protein ENJ82_08390, partial [Bacteroidetes bacterium]|nr:hypothetical protein [Bacteroidota bacterium]